MYGEPFKIESIAMDVKIFLMLSKKPQHRILCLAGCHCLLLNGKRLRIVIIPQTDGSHRLNW